MKKILPVIVAILLCGTAFAGETGIEVRGLYFSPSEQAFKDIYGGGVSFGLDLSFNLWNAVDIWIGGSYFTKTGELSFTKEDTTIRIIPLGLGVRYRFIKDGTVSPYAGLGVNYFLFTEENIIGKVEKGAVGPVVRVGVLLNVAKGFFFDLMVEYSYCRINPADFRINIGGISAGIGAGIDF
ncbi:OmpW family outer membrane protein [Acidobacteriota bacterium]